VPAPKVTGPAARSLAPLPSAARVLRLPRVAARTTRRAQLPRMAVGLLAAVAGCVGGIYGIGGGSILPPVLVADGQPSALVAPASLSSAFVTSLAGVVTFSILSVHQHGSVAPDWPTGSRWGPVAWPAGMPVPACTPGCRKSSSGACWRSSCWRSASGSWWQALLAERECR
jgi:hypothetical protein